MTTVRSVGDPAVVEIAATDYTLNGTEGSQCLYFTSAEAITLTIPPDDAVDIPINTSILFVQAGSGAILFAAGSGVELNSFNGANQTGGPFSGGALIKTAPNTWYLSGGGGLPGISMIGATSYELNGTEGGSYLYFTSMDAITLTVPADIDVNLPVGTGIGIVQGGSGAVLISPADDTVTINSFNGLNQTAGSFATASLFKTAPDTWLLAGALTA